jgi:hypothetical protein
MKFPLVVVLIALCVLATLSAQNAPTPAAQLGSITGRLLAVDGTPAANVRVSAQVVDAASTDNGTALLSITQTDASGNYRLENVRPGRYYIIAGFVDAPSYFPGVGDRTGATIITIGAQEARTGVDFRMAIPTGLRFSGRVIRQTSDGVVVPAAAPGATGPAFALVVGALSPQGPQIRLSNISGGGGVPGVVPSAAIAPDGSFEISNIRPGTYDVQLMQPGASFPRLNVNINVREKDVTDFQLVVPLMVALTGTVSIEGGGLLPRLQLALSRRTAAQPLPQLAVNAIQPNPRIAAARIFNSSLQTGEYSISALDLPAGFVIKSMTSGTDDISVNPLKVVATGVPPIKVVLSVSTPSPWVRLSGRVVGRAERYRVVNFNVNAQVLADLLEPDFYLDGSFEIPMALPSQYRFMTSTLGSPMMNSTITVGSTGLSDGVIYVPDDAIPTSLAAGRADVRVAGRIVGRARAQSGARVRMTNTSLGERISAPIYMDGTFEFPHVTPGTYAAEVYPAVPGALPTPVVVSSADIRDLKVTVPDTREVPGRVLASGEVPVPRSMEISVGTRDKLRIPIAPDGSFSVTLSAGEKITVNADSLPSGYVVDSMNYGAQNLLTTPLSFTGSSTEELRVSLRAAIPPATVRGRVVGIASLPSGSHVWLTDFGGNQRTLETSINPDGSFAFARVAAGTYSIRLSTPGLPATTAATPVVVAGNDVSGVEISSAR